MTSTQSAWINMNTSKTTKAACSSLNWYLKTRHRCPVVGLAVTPGDSNMDGHIESKDTMFTQVRGVGRHGLTLFQVLLLNAIVCGLEFCASAAFTYIPPMLLKAGLIEEHMSIVLGIGPLIGFFAVPMIGRWSDRCRSPYGRRRPFILGLSLALILSLFIIPYGERLSTAILGQSNVSLHLGTIFIIVGSVMLDFTSQACLTPCEALLSDASKMNNQQERCFTVYSIMVSLGGCIGYLITAIDWSDMYISEVFGGQEQTAFSMLIILFTLMLVVTLNVAQEKPLPDSSEDSADTDLLDKIQQVIGHKDPTVLNILPPDPGYESDVNESSAEGSEQDGLISTRPDSINYQSYLRWPQRLLRCVTMPSSRWTITDIDSFIHLLCLRTYSLMPEFVQAYFYVPTVLKRLALANFFSWAAVMGFNLFFTDFVGQAVYGGNPNAPTDSPLQGLYDEGVRMGSWGLLLHCVTSALYATCIGRLITRFGSRQTYFIGMFSFSIAMAVMMFSRNVYVIITMAACTGFGYATMTTVPFLLVTAYHDDKLVGST